jgi:hypothetical protein
MSDYSRRLDKRHQIIYIRFMSNPWENPASWVVVSCDTGKAILETYSKTVASRVRSDKYIVMPIMDWLVSRSDKGFFPKNPFLAPFPSARHKEASK